MDSIELHTREGFVIRNTLEDVKPNPCPDCGLPYKVANSVQVRVMDRTEPVWDGCIDCWIKRTSPEMCQTFVKDE